MAKVSPDDEYVGLADPALLAKQFPDLDLLDPQMPSVAELERRALEGTRNAGAGRAVGAPPPFPPINIYGNQPQQQSQAPQIKKVNLEKTIELIEGSKRSRVEMVP